MRGYKKGDRVRIKAGMGTAPHYTDGREFTVVREHPSASVYGGRYWKLQEMLEDFPHHNCNGDRLELVKSSTLRDYVADHARRTLRKAGMDKADARNVVAAIQAVGAGWRPGKHLSALCTEDAIGTPRFDLSKLSRSTQGVTLADLTSNSFSWYSAQDALGVNFADLHHKYKEAEAAA